MCNLHLCIAINIQYFLVQVLGTLVIHCFLNHFLFLVKTFNVDINYYRICREISFQFRTKLPHGLLVYHSVKDRPDDLEPYALYIIVEKGELKVVHVFGEESTSVTVGEGMCYSYLQN